MGRFLLLLIAAATGGSMLLNSGLSGDRSHTLNQQQALVRQTLDDAVATVLDAAIDPATKRWRASFPLGRTFRVDGYRVDVEDYHLELGNTVVAFRLAAYRGGVGQRIESRYRIPNTGWPGPIWVDAPYAVSQIDPRATINATTGRKSYFDATRFTAYRLESVLNLSDIPLDFGLGLSTVRGTRAPLEVVSSMEAVRGQFGAPSPIELVGRALGSMGAGDTRLTGPVTITDRRMYGAFPATTPDDARIVHVTGDLTIGTSGRVSGNGLLLVDGTLTVTGRLEWTGLILVRPRGQHVAVDWSSGKVELNGGLVVDQEAPPPGGHTDVTINRALTGNWGMGAIGETGPGTPGNTEFGPYARYFGLQGLLYDHEHRFESATPEKRTIHFADRTGSPADRHERFTWFRKTLTDLAATQPAERFYVRFKNPSGHGAALFHIVTRDGTIYDGAVATGFGARARPGDAYASPSFLPADLNTFVVDVQSLRLLTRLTDGEVPASPFWPYGTSACPSRPMCIGFLSDRDGALAVQIVRDSDDEPVYEATVYWHTQEPGSTQHAEELAADDAWRDAIRSGAEYGALVRFGNQVQISFEDRFVAAITNRLGFGQTAIQHVGSIVEHFDPS
ncbi:MAG TPA: hypothetical protein VF594_05520 [Rubricoccaceae bacterium]|jgi:hypothetical protein